MIEPLHADDPRQVGPYQLKYRLGAGGMGQVFLGHSDSGRPVAVKVIHPELAEDPQFRRRFALEVEAARCVSGAFTAPLVAADIAADPPWLVTDYLPGPSLQEAVGRQRPLHLMRVKVLGADLAEGLNAIHACGLVHRDLKPSNVLLASNAARVIDFGIARALDATTQTTTPIGTAPYMSPEQARGDRVVGPPSDVFSLGAVLAFAATGTNPFGTGSYPAIVYRVVHEDPDLTGVPATLVDLVTACLAKNPDERPEVPYILNQLAVSAAVRAAWWPPPEITAVITERTAVATGQLPGGSDAAADTAAEPSWRLAPHPRQPPPDASAPPVTLRGVRRSRIVSGGIGCALFVVTFPAIVEAAAWTPPIGPFQQGPTFHIGLLVLLLVLVYGVPGVAWWLLLYPARLSQWRFTFGRNAAYRDARRPLRQVRQQRRTLHSRNRREISAAKRRIKKMEKVDQERIRALEKQRDDALRPPGPGGPVDELAGYLQLYEHVLVILPEDPAAGMGKEQTELDGLRATFQTGFNNTIIMLIWPNGTKRNVPIPHSRHSEDRVVKFEEQINDAVVRDRKFRRQRQSEAANFDRKVKQLEADTAAKVDEARRELASLREAHHTNPERIQADAEWEKQCEAWQALTGRRPPWLWWW